MKMKRVILPNKNNREFVYAHDASTDLYYGVVNKKTDERGLIVQQDYRKGMFRVLCEQSLTVSNRFILNGTEEFPSLQAALTAILENPSYEVYEFDNPRDLFKWLA